MNRSLTRRILGATAAALVAVATAASLAACGGPSAAADAGSPTSGGTLVPLKVGAPWNGTAGKTPTDTGTFGYAVEKGLAEPILEKYGFTYEGFAAFNNGPPVVQALESGDIQVGLIGDTPAAQAKASGIDVPALSIAKPSSDIWFLGKVGGGVESVADLKGKTVGLQFGSNFDKYGRAVLEKAGILKDVKIVNLLFADALPALQRGDIDAVPLPATTAGIWRLTDDFPVISKASEDDPELLATSVALTSREAADAHPKIAEAVWAVQQAGIDAIQSDHDAYAAWVEQATGAPKAVVLAANTWKFGTERLDPDGLKTVQSTLDYLVDNGTAPRAFDVATWGLQ
ncbi:ABC transporter substrate-binding protein [Xylanimonas sp. McL0601]|uniref:ABC transporter substrate-binding protein n=1 Tax=Xylanimonas sp. McL0601 TaxID=3414739 RepID=UPI003CF8476A